MELAALLVGLLTTGSVESSPWHHHTAADERMAHPVWAAGRVSPSPGAAAFHGVDVEYDLDGKTYQGYVSHPTGKSVAGGTRGALIAHQWKGLGDYEKSRADERRRWVTSPSRSNIH